MDRSCFGSGATLDSAKELGGQGGGELYKIADNIIFVNFLNAAAKDTSKVTHPYRTHNCGELRLSHKDQTVRISGWVHRKRDHGSLLFIDIRDNYGLTQCVIDRSSPLLA